MPFSKVDSLLGEIQEKLTPGEIQELIYKLQRPSERQKEKTSTERI